MCKCVHANDSPNRLLSQLLFMGTTVRGPVPKFCISPWTFQRPVDNNAEIERRLINSPLHRFRLSMSVKLRLFGYIRQIIRKAMSSASSVSSHETVVSVDEEILSLTHSSLISMATRPIKKTRSNTCPPAGQYLCELLFLELFGAST